MQQGVIEERPEIFHDLAADEVPDERQQDDFEDLMQQWSATLPSSGSSSSSGSTSSSSSSSDDEGGAAPAARIPNQNVEDVAADHVVVATLDADQEGQRQRHARPESFVWGPQGDFHFVFKPPRTFECWSKRHSRGRTRRTKTRSWTAKQTPEEALLHLKAWCLEAANYNTKEAHQGAREAPALSAEHRAMTEEEWEQRVANMPLAPAG